MLASQGILTYCANRRSTVPMYADAFGLLVLTASLTSVSLSKNKFFDRLKRTRLGALFSYSVTITYCTELTTSFSKMMVSLPLPLVTSNALVPL